MKTQGKHSLTWVLAIILLDRTPKAQQQKQIQPSGGKISGIGDATKKKNKWVYIQLKTSAQQKK